MTDEENRRRARNICGRIGTNSIMAGVLCRIVGLLADQSILLTAGQAFLLAGIGFMVCWFRLREE